MKEVPHPIQEVVGKSSTLNPAQKYNLRRWDYKIALWGARSYPERWKIQTEYEIQERNEKLRLVK